MANISDDAPTGSWRRNVVVNFVSNAVSWGLAPWGLTAWGETKPNPSWTRTKP